MEKIDATVVHEGDNVFLNIEHAVEGDIKIPLSDDQPTTVKAAFNKLVGALKTGPFEIELKNRADDLFNQVADAYLEQLNRELREVYAEIVRLGFAPE